MSTGLPHPPGLDDGLGYPFFQSVFDRKSRRMGLGMSMPGTLGYDSPYEAVPLTELEEALGFPAVDPHGSPIPARRAAS